MYQRCWFFGLCFVFFGALVGCESFNLQPPAIEEVRADADKVVDDRQIVVLARTRSQVEQLLEQANVRGYQALSQEDMEGLGLFLVVLKTPSGLSSDAAIRELERLSPGVTAGVNHAYVPPAIVSSQQGRTYADAMMGRPDTTCEARLSIGVIDGAIANSDGAFGQSPLIVKDFTAGSSTADDHAKMVAEVMVGSKRLSGATLVNAVVVGEHRQASSAAGVDNLVRALNWMQVSDVNLVNVSLSGPYNKILDRAVQSATARGLLIVAAAGNDGADSPPRYPAAFNSVLAVTAVDARGDIFENAVQGEQIDFAAPGVDVLLAQANRYVSGTSVAAPFLTALIAADKEMLLAGDAKNIRQRLAVNARDLGATGRDPVYGYGLAQYSADCE